MLKVVCPAKYMYQMDQFIQFVYKNWSVSSKLKMCESAWYQFLKVEICPTKKSIQQIPEKHVHSNTLVYLTQKLSFSTKFCTCTWFLFLNKVTAWCGFIWKTGCIHRQHTSKFTRTQKTTSWVYNEWGLCYINFDAYKTSLLWCPHDHYKTASVLNSNSNLSFFVHHRLVRWHQ